MRIAIVGAGFTGLTLAFRLSQKGHKVTVFEREKKLGGLAACFRQKNWNWHLEDFFHHFFVSDKNLQKLIAELGLSEKLFYKRVKTSIYKSGTISPFDSVFSLLNFPHLSLLEKLRTGFTTFYLKSLPYPFLLEKTTASAWLKKFYGKNSYQTLWEPLLVGKFGTEKRKILMSWFWARIKKRSSRLGYIEGGTSTLIDKIAQKIKESGGRISLNNQISCVNDLNHGNKFDRIILTTPSSIFSKIAPQLPEEYKKNLKNLKMIGALNLILVLKEKFLKDNTYWLNINEKEFPFVAVVEHTNFVDKKYYGGNHILYIGGYYPQNHHYFKMKKEKILKEFLPYLKKINPRFGRSSLISYHLSKNLYAQPIMTTYYPKRIPPFETPLKNIYLANMQQIYPWDRGIDNAIALGERIANEIQNS